ncbi:MAG TPA: GAF domain-containing sensor histidine kinase [Anaerolineaceae bacterium]|nr:GAF domain-containing sensor histidine kinase [Anaerolineaceae bacterium]
MRIYDAPFLADWYAIFFRWLTLIIVSIVAGLTGWFTIFTASLISLSTLWNVILTFMALSNRRFNAQRLLNVVVDLLVTGSLFFLSGGLAGSLPWILLLPVITGGIYYEWKGALWTALLAALIQLTWTIFGSMYGMERFIWLGIAVGITGVFALATGWLTHRLLSRLRAKHQALLQQRQQVEETSLRYERDHIQKFYRLIENLSTTLDYQEVLDTILDLSVAGMGEPQQKAELMARAVLLFGENDLGIACSRRFTPHDQKVPLPGNQGALGDVLARGEPVLVDDPARDPELSRLVGVQTCQAAYCLPLMRGLDSYGILLLAHPESDFFTEDRRETLELLSHQAVIAIQNARLFRDLAEEKEALISAQEETRKQLARDLHDGPTQAVAALAMRASIAGKYLDSNALADARTEIDQIESLARRTTNEIRHMLFTLRPLQLESQGLDAALQTMAEKMKDNYQQNVVLELDPASLARLDTNKQGVTFYLVEEAVNNARKHARADTITVRLRSIPQDADILLLEIADNGVGFDMNQVKTNYEKRGSLGMVNLRERTDLINGLLHIDSAPGKGTRIRIFIPLSEAAIDRLQRSR